MKAIWSDEKVLAKVREMVLPAIERHGPIEAWIIDDTGFPKKGRHSVGVARQYCGELGKQDNCQIAVTLSIANHHASLPAAYRIYLPKEWAMDRARRRAGEQRRSESGDYPGDQPTSGNDLVKLAFTRVRVRTRFASRCRCCRQR